MWKLKKLHQQVGHKVFLVKRPCAYQTTRHNLHITGSSDVLIREASQGLKKRYSLAYLKLLSHHLTEQQSGKHHLHQLFDSWGWRSTGKPMNAMPDIFYLISFQLTASFT